MNANELADELDDYYIAITDEYTGFGYLKEAATMLRQQQAEIEALKEALSMKVILNEHAQQSIKIVKDLLK